MKSPFETLTDGDLLTKMLSNEPRAWKEFERRFDRLVWQQVLRIGRRLGKRLTRTDLEEMRADFYAALVMNDYRKLRLYDPARGMKLSSWVGLLAANAARDFIRALRRRPRTTSIEDRDQELRSERDLFEQTAQREKCAHMMSAFQTLPERDRALLWGLYIEERSPEEVADACDISPKTVYTRCHRLRAEVKRRAGGRAKIAA
ncbi:MAG: sigma-70 family RNA polymerase sigma factor [Polyangiales bacterium]